MKKLLAVRCQVWTKPLNCKQPNILLFNHLDLPIIFVQHHFQISDDIIIRRLMPLLKPPPCGRSAVSSDLISTHIMTIYCKSQENRFFTEIAWSIHKRFKRFLQLSPPRRQAICKKNSLLRVIDTTLGQYIRLTFECSQFSTTEVPSCSNSNYRASTEVQKAASTWNYARTSFRQPMTDTPVRFVRSNIMFRTLSHRFLLNFAR